MDAVLEARGITKRFPGTVALDAVDFTLARGEVHALLGENGAGKTNLLEAVSLLAPGRGLRVAALPEMARQGGAGGFTVAARLADDVAVMDSGCIVEQGDVESLFNAPQHSITRSLVAAHLALYGLELA